MLFTNLEKTNGGQAVLAPFDWEKHGYLKKYDSSAYSYSAYESLKKHYSKYASVITEICLADKSATVWSMCGYCTEEKEKMIKLGEWNEEDLKVVIADCERFLDERFQKALQEKRDMYWFVPFRKSVLDKPMYYRKDKQIVKKALTSVK